MVNHSLYATTVKFLAGSCALILRMNGLAGSFTTPEGDSPSVVGLGVGSGTAILMSMLFECLNPHPFD